MKIHDNYCPVAGYHEVDIPAAVQRACDNQNSDQRGAIECAENALTATGELLGRLLNKLHAKGLLDDDVLDVLGYRFSSIKEK